MMEKIPKVRTFSLQKSTGNFQSWKRADPLEILSDSSSCGTYSTEEELYSCNVSRSGRKRAGGAPMKNLLEEELSKEMEPKRRPPSVIGRLMGLDTLPPQQPVKKQQKKFSESYHKKTASIGYLDRRSTHDGRSVKVKKKEQQEFKDVFEVLESEKPEKHPDFFMDEGTTNSNFNETKMEFVRGKFMDVKRLSTDAKLQQSKEFHDALEVLDSNKDILLKFLEEPDSLFAKHLRDLHGVPSPPQPGHIAVLQSSNGHGKLHRKSDRNAERNDVVSSSQEHGQGISHSRRKNVYIPSKISKSQDHGTEGTCQLPTRIVVLKPNLKKVSAEPMSSPESSRGFLPGHGKNREFGSSESLELFEELRNRRDSSFDLECMRHTSRGSREIAKEITRQMRHSVSSNSKMVPNSRLRGYAGDESSYYLSDNDSANEYGARTPNMRHFNDWKSRHSPTSSYSAESSVSREAKKRLSERWKMTHRSQEVGKGSRGSTLGEMLAMPDKETSVTTSDSVAGPDGFSERLSRNGGLTRCACPLGISSRDGWKDERVRSLPRSKSLPASSTCLNSPITNVRNKSPGKDRYPTRRSTNSKRVESEHRDGLFLKSSTKSSRKKYSYSVSSGGESNHTVWDSDLKSEEQRCVGGETSHPVQDGDTKPDELQISFEGVELSEWKLGTLEIPVDDLAETTTSVNGPELSANTSNPEMTPTGPAERSSMFSECTITEAESPASSKEAGEPSPVSVLEPPFVEEFSSSDSFSQISADLHGLRMQLQLLKLETSDAYSEGSEMIVSSDEDAGEESRGLPGGIRVEVNRDYSYLVDVLVDCGFHAGDLDVLLKTWYSPELPIALSVLDKLEKKYGEETSWLISDRKLLFDRINLGLIELLQPHMDPHPWAKMGKTIGRKWRGENVVEELWNLLVKQGNDLDKDSLDNTLMKEMNWSEWGDDINAVGNDIERSLFDELVVEVVSGLVKSPDA